MTQTTYADASGFSDNSVSTASDVLIVAAKAMAIPAFAAIVKMPTVTLPVAGTLTTYTPLLGYLGVIGVKSGFTTKAGGCDVMAVERVVGGHTVTILTSVTGQVGTDQPNVLLVAGVATLTLADAVTNELGSLDLIHAGALVAHASANGHSVGVVAGHTVSVLTWPGIVYRRTVVAGRAVKPGDKVGTRAGWWSPRSGAPTSWCRLCSGRRCPRRRSSSAYSNGVRARAPASSANLGPGFDVLAIALECYIHVDVTPAASLEVHSSGKGAHLSSDASHLAAKVVTEVLGHDRFSLTVHSGSPCRADSDHLPRSQPRPRAAAGAHDPLAIAAAYDGHPENAAASVMGGLVAATKVGDSIQATHLALDDALRLLSP